MLLDIGRDDALLPGGKPAANQLFRRRATLLQQRKDIDDLLAGLDEVQVLCEKALGKRRNKVSATKRK